MSPSYCNANLFCWLLGDNTLVPKGFSDSLMFQSPTFFFFFPPPLKHEYHICSENVFLKYVKCCCLTCENVEPEATVALGSKTCKN